MPAKPSGKRVAPHAKVPESGHAGPRQPGYAATQRSNPHESQARPLVAWRG